MTKYMKYKAHYAVAQYEFIEAEYDTLVDAKVDYDNIKKTFAGEQIQGMDKNTWAKFRDKFMVDCSYTGDELDKMSPVQKWFVHQFENGMKNINNKDK